MEGGCGAATHDRLYPADGNGAGGLGSVAGAFLAGVLLGIVSTVSAFYIGQYITTIVLLAAAALTIVMRPRGLLGR